VFILDRGSQGCGYHQGSARRASVVITPGTKLAVIAPYDVGVLAAPPPQEGSFAPHTGGSHGSR